MDKIADLWVRIGADDSEFRRTVERLPATLERAGQRLQAVGLNLTRYVALPIAAIGTAAVAAGTRMDSMRRALAAVAGSAEAANRQLVTLRDVAKAPGLGFAEAVQGAVRLQAVGIEFETAARALKAFGNAIATTGGGKAELDRITVQLGQLSSKGKILAQDLRPIIEAAPAVGKALKDAFGTVDTEVIGQLGLSTEQFLDTLITQLEKLPQVTGGPRNAFENLQDSLLQLGDTLSKQFLPAIDDLVSGLASFAGSADGINGTLVRVAGSFAVVLAALAPLTVALWGLVSVAGALSVSFAPVLTVFAAILVPLTALVSWYVKSAKAADDAAAAATRFSEALKSQNKEVLLTAMLTEEQRLADLENAPLWDQRKIAATRLRLRELRNEYEKLVNVKPPAATGSDIVTRGWGPFPSLASMARIAEALDAAREKLADLQFKSGLPQTRDDAEELAKQLARVRLEIAALEAGFGTLGEAAARAMLAVSPALIKASTNIVPPTQKPRFVGGRMVEGGFIPPITSVQPILSRVPPEVTQAAGELTQAFDGVAAAAFGTRTGLGDLVGSLASFGQSIAGKLGSGAIVGAGMAAFQAIAGLFQDSPEEQEARRVARENTQALQRLNSGIARLGDALRSQAGGDIGSFGSAATAAVAAMQRALQNADPAGMADIIRGGTFPFLSAELSKFGLTLDDARRIAQAYGIELTGSIGSLAAFSEALKRVSVADLFASFAGQNQLADLQTKLFGLDSAEQLRGLVQRFLDATNLGALGEGLRTTNVEAFQEALRALFTALPSLDFSAFGDLSVSEFLEAISQMFDLSESAQTAADSLDKMTASLSNVPTIFKVALERFNATVPTSGFAAAAAINGGVRPAAGAASFVVEGDVIVQGVERPEEFYRAVTDEAARRRSRGGSSKFSRVAK